MYVGIAVNFKHKEKPRTALADEALYIINKDLALQTLAFRHHLIILLII